MLGYVTDPAAPAGIIRRELPEPHPGEHDVVVEVAAYSVNRGELALIEARPDALGAGTGRRGCDRRGRGGWDGTRRRYPRGGYRRPGRVE